MSKRPRSVCEEKVYESIFNDHSETLYIINVAI